MREPTLIPVFVNGKRVQLRGWVETDPNSVSVGDRGFEAPVAHGQVAELAGMTIQGASVLISYTDTQGTRTLALGATLVPLPDSHFTVTYA